MSGDAQTEAVALDAATLRRLATSLSDQFALLYDARPIDPTVGVINDSLVYAFHGGLTLADERLMDAGRGAEVREFRERFLKVAGEQLSAVVEALTGGAVTSFFGTFDPVSGLTEGTFFIDSRPDRVLEERQALLNWSAQVRRNARSLRDEHVASREAHHALQESLRDLREESEGRRRLLEEKLDSDDG
jgi:uncharacterized protein YbcI